MADITITNRTVRNSGFWFGFFLGASLLAVMDLSDIHVCVGECDGAGYDLMEIKKIQRK